MRSHVGEHKDSGDDQNVLEIEKKVKDFGSIYEIQIALIINFKEVDKL